VRLLAPLADDLAWWRSRCPSPGPDALVFPTPRCGLWTKDDWNNWRNRVFRPATGRIGASHRPYDLRHTFASLLIAAGGTVVEIAARLGHDPALALGTYAHLFEEFDFGLGPDQVETIGHARSVTGVREMYAEPDDADLTDSRDPSSELEANERTRTADLFITREMVLRRISGAQQDSNLRPLAPEATLGRKWRDAKPCGNAGLPRYLLPPAHMASSRGLPTLS
jgi:hypothetical protein